MRCKDCDLRIFKLIILSGMIAHFYNIIACFLVRGKPWMIQLWRLVSKSCIFS